MEEEKNTHWQEMRATLQQGVYKAIPVFLILGEG